MTGLASAAFRLALRGLAVFPLTPGQKVPLLGSHGCHDGSTDSDIARARWKRSPNSNIGVKTGAASGVWVLDIDLGPGGDASLARLEAEHGPLPATVEVLTPSGGRHYWWRWPASGPEIRNSAGRIGPGLDVRGEGGSVVAPPSALSDGGRYRWVKNGTHAIAEAPAWLVTLALPPPPPPRPEPKPPPDDIARYAASAAAAELAELETATEGARNDALNRASFALAQFVKAGALPEDWTRGQLEARAVGVGLPAVEAGATISSAMRAARSAVSLCRTLRPPCVACPLFENRRVPIVKLEQSLNNHHQGLRAQLSCN